MMPTIAENALTLDYPVIAAIATAMFGAVTAFVVWLWMHFKKSDREKDSRMGKLEGRMDTLERAVSGQSQFVSAVVGASKAADHVPSRVIHELHDQYKPTDRTGTHHPIIKIK
jgi:hypothetical protein